MPVKTFLDLEVYQQARQLAKEIFNLTIKFPPEEKYSLTDQIRRSSRSISANIAEGWSKRIYINSFKRHLVDANARLTGRAGIIRRIEVMVNFCIGL